MSEQIILRGIQKQDYKELQNIIRETWHYDDFCSAKTAAKLARVYLSSCLANQTFTQAAVVDNKPVGFIMAKNISKYKKNIKLQLRMFAAIISLVISKEGRKVSKIFGGVSEIDKELLKQTQKNYLGEIAFFAVKSKERGKGLGKKLFHSSVTYMIKENIDEFYLFTDTSCNYKFYEHQGMTRCMQKKHSFTINEIKKEMTFYLYDYKL